MKSSCPKNTTAGASASRHEVGLLRQKIVDLILQKPEKAALILTEWVSPSTQTKPKKKAG